MSEMPNRSHGHTEAADLQLAIFDVAAHAKGKSVDHARHMLAAEIDRRNLTPPSGLWVDAAATSAALGKPYIISNEARWEAEAALRPCQGQSIPLKGQPEQ